MRIGTSFGHFRELRRIGRSGLIGLLAACVVLAVAGCRNEGGTETGTGDVRTVAVEKRELSVGGDLTYAESADIRHAKGFAIDYYTQPGVGGTEDAIYTVLTLCDGKRYLLLREGQEAPKGLMEDVCVIAKPFEQIYMVNSAAYDMVAAIGAEDCVGFVGTREEDWSIESARVRLQEQTMTYAGKYSSPDYELLANAGCDLAVENTMIYHSPEVVEKLETLGIPVVVDYASLEQDPLGRVEWIRFYGCLFDRDREAEEAFAAQEAIVDKLKGAEPTGKTVVFFYMTDNGIVNVRSGRNYIAQMIEIAGGEYVFRDLYPDSNRASVAIQMEEFYKQAKDADYLIYNSSISGEIETVEDLLAKDATFADFKAVKNKQVYCAGNNLYQESMSAGAMMEDFYYMLHGEDEKLVYLTRVE